MFYRILWLLTGAILLFPALFCDYYNPEGECEWHYKPCGAPCMKTCRNPSGQCMNNLPGLEGKIIWNMPYLILDWFNSHYLNSSLYWLNCSCSAQCRGWPIKTPLRKTWFPTNDLLIAMLKFLATSWRVQGKLRTATQSCITWCSFKWMLQSRCECLIHSVHLWF